MLLENYEKPISRIAVIESPHSGCVPLHEAYLEACIRTAARLGFAPYNSAKMMTRALNDKIPRERKIGIDCGIFIRDHLPRDITVSLFFVDLAWSDGMRLAYDSALKSNQAFSIVSIEGEGEWDRVLDEARFSDARFADCLRGIRMVQDARLNAIAAKALWAERHAA